MVSTCPSCLNQVNHEDHLFEVTCDCGIHFNPFLAFGDTYSPVPPAVPPEVPPVPPAIAGYSGERFEESLSAFREIQAFGETISSDSPEPARSIVPSSVPKVAATSPILITSADSLQTNPVLKYLPAISLWTKFDSGIADPLKPILELVAVLAKDAGAHAVLSMRWQIANDARHILVTGTPVILSNPSA